MKESDGELEVHHGGTCSEEGKREAGRDCCEDGKREGDKEQQRQAEHIQWSAKEAHDDLLYG